MRHAIEVEEKIPMDTVTNFDEVKKMMPCEFFIFSVFMFRFYEINDLSNVSHSGLPGCRRKIVYASRHAESP